MPAPFDAWIAWGLAHIEAVIAVVSAIVAVFGAVFSAIENRRRRDLQLEALRVEIDKSRLAWGRIAVATVAEAAGLARGFRSFPDRQAFEREAHGLAARLSGLTDEGRLFFPNLGPEAKGHEKELAFRGSRPPVLDAVLYVHREVMCFCVPGQGPDPTSAKYITRCQRLLISELQAYIDPRRQQAMFDRAGRYHQDAAHGAWRQSALLHRLMTARHPQSDPHRGDHDRAAAVSDAEAGEFIAKFYKD